MVTLLFADLVGYTRLCSSLDVEQVFLLVRPLMNALRRRCEDLGGVVPVIEGDGFMAVFGAQFAQEDDPQRALFAAVEMQRLVEARRAAYGGEMGGLRVGLNTGEVLVAPSWESSGFSVSGDPVNVASRLSGVAGEGEVLVGTTLSRLVAFDGIFGDTQSVVVRNRVEPVTYRPLSWRVLEARNLDRRGLSSLPYVRPEADAALRALVHAGGSVHLVGEPGAGKSRALLEIEGQVGARALPTFAPSFVGPTVRSQLASALLTRVGDVLPVRHERALRAVAGQAVDSTEADADEILVEALQNGLRAWERAVLLVDDVHLCDERDRRLLRLLVAGLPAELVLVATSRSDDAYDLGCELLRLEPLDAGAVRTLVATLLPGAPERLVQLLVERSGGNPLYLEQAVQLLLEDGTVEVTPSGCEVRRPEQLAAVPVAMRLFVSSRLDLLDDRSRDLLSLAAVVGDPVDLDLLRHLDNRRLDQGDVVEVLVEKGLLRWVEGPVLRFKHQIVRDVAYERLLRSHRTGLHRVASEWYAVLPVSGLLGAEASHLEAAIGLGDADCDLVRRAVTVLGNLALSLLDEATGEAVVALDRADTLAAAHPQCEVDLVPLVVTRANALELLGLPAALQVSTRAVALARERGDQRLLADALLALAVAEHWLDEPPVDSVASEAEALLDALGDQAGRARLRLDRAYFQAPEDLRTLLTAAEDAYRVAVLTGDARLATRAALELAEFLPVRDPGEADRWRKVAEAGMRPHDVVAPARLAMAQVQTDSVTLEPVRQLASAERLRRAASAAALPRSAFYADVFTMEAATELGRLDVVERLMPGLLQQTVERPLPMVLIQLHLRTVALRARQGRLPEVDAALAAADEIVQKTGAFLEAAVGEARGTVLLERGHFAAALNQLDRAHALDLDLEQPALGLRLSLTRLVAALSSGRRLPNSELQLLRETARTIGAPAVAALAARWLELDELLRAPHSHDLDLPPAPDLATARALDHEIAVLSGGDPDGLLAAAAEWATLGTVVWTARALVWHSAITGVSHPEATDLLVLLDAPPELAGRLGAQVARRRVAD